MYYYYLGKKTILLELSCIKSKLMH